ncbi:MAG TPA: phage tail sheath subtilisin-like domain-containing protein [Pyrinomonadaceae bacterium]|nr:phage tail sheath subtilisin-like domain-containing protein [Pyrinomonadaceae bacterium]
MPEYLSPGVYVEEISTGPVPIEGVSTSTAAMLGATERGPEYPKLITSWLQYQRWYGGYIPDVSYLTYAVQGFFDNGGQRVFIARIIDPTGSSATAGAADDLTFTACGRGEWGNRIMVKISGAGNQVPTNFRVSILYYSTKKLPPNFPNIVDPTSNAVADLTDPNRRDPDVLEVFDNLTTEGGASNNAVTVINSNSKLVKAAWGATSNQPAPQPFTQLGTTGADGATPITSAMFTGDDQPIGGNELLGRGRGLAAIEAIDEISLLLAPDEVRNMRPVSEAVLNQCELLKDRFAIISESQGKSDVATIQPTRDSSYGAFYYPWIRIFDPSINDTRLIPATGHVAGIYARTDIERGVHKAPANEVIRGAVDLEFPVPKGNQDILNPRGVNCARDFRSDGRGIRLWGARTMSSNGEWKYINVRRLFLYVEESIDEGTQWVVFEPNDEPLWARVRRSVTGFLRGVHRSGALMGTTEDEAFFVKCDRTTMTQDDIDNGRLICYIGIAPVKPAEFVIFRISQKTIEAQQ